MRLFNYLKNFAFFIFRLTNVKDFDARFVKENIKALIQTKRENEWIACLRGALRPIGKIPFWFRNLLTLGAERAWTEKTILYTLIVFCLEYSNPFDKDLLRKVVNGKVAFVRRLWDKYRAQHGKKGTVDQRLEVHLNLYVKGSWMQHRVIQNMQRAVAAQKESAAARDVKRALKKGLSPVLTTVGYSGAYWMRDTNRNVAGLFKPFDEEIHARNNPMGVRFQGALGKRRTRLGIRVGECAHREVAAYLVDAFFGLGLVPKTGYAEFTHHLFFQTGEAERVFQKQEKTKWGSFQEYAKGYHPFASISREEFEKIPLEEFQRLVLLDVLIGNTDRNPGNILIKNGKLAAVDHGLCFSESFLDPLAVWFWTSDFHGNRPLTPHILHLLDHRPLPDLLWKLKKRCFLQWPALHRMRERLALFRAGANLGMTPFRLSSLLAPEYLSRLYELDETLERRALEAAQSYTYSNS